MSASTRSCHSPHAANGQSAQQPAQQQQLTAGAAAAAYRGGLSDSQISSRQDPHKVLSNSKFNPQTPLRNCTKIQLF